jgi:hypothetical protein
MCFRHVCPANPNITTATAANDIASPHSVEPSPASGAAPNSSSIQSGNGRSGLAGRSHQEVVMIVGKTSSHFLPRCSYDDSFFFISTFDASSIYKQ